MAFGALLILVSAVVYFFSVDLVQEGTAFGAVLGGVGIAAAAVAGFIGVGYAMGVC